MVSDKMTVIWFRRILARKMSRGRQGKLFESMTHNALARLKENTKKGAFWFQRIWDYKTYIAINPNLFCFKQPADYMALSFGHFYMIECKSSVQGRYLLANVKPHQEQAMELIERAGGHYWLLILHRDRDSRTHDCYALRQEGWDKVKDTARKEGHDSASWDTIAKFAYRKLERKEGVWDLSPLFATIFPDRLPEPLFEEKRGRLKMRKVYEHNIRGKGRDVDYMWSHEFPMVAFYDMQSEDITVLLDVWCKKTWRNWWHFGEKWFTNMLIRDTGVTVVHELIHWAAPKLPNLEKVSIDEDDDTHKPYVFDEADTKHKFYDWVEKVATAAVYYVLGDACDVQELSKNIQCCIIEIDGDEKDVR